MASGKVLSFPVQGFVLGKYSVVFWSAVTGFSLGEHANWDVYSFWYLGKDSSNYLGFPGELREMATQSPEFSAGSPPSGTPASFICKNYGPPYAHFN